MRLETVDVLIIGAGPSGCVAAAYLHQQGVKVKVVEKTKFPRFTIGESLLPRSMDHFEEVGLLDALQSRGYEEKHGARFIKNHAHCHFDFSDKFTDGYNWTWQVPRADFDHTIATAIAQRGVDIAFETTVVDVSFANQISTTTIEHINGSQQIIQANFIIDASGNGRVLPRILGLIKPSPMPKNASIFTHVKDERRPKDKEGTLITFDIVKTKVWLWVIPFSNGITSIGVVGPTDFISSYGEDTSEALKKMLQLSNHYADRFKDLPFLFKPYRFNNIAKAVTQIYGEGYAITGNSAEFLDPVFSSGVTFATESGLVAAKLAAKQLHGETVNWQTEYADYMHKGINVFSSYVQEWYTGNLQKLFFHEPPNLDVKRKICAVLAGYVWDESNPFVKKHYRIIKSLAHLLYMNEKTTVT